MTDIQKVPAPGITITCPHCGYQQRKNLPFLRAYFKNGEKGSIVCLSCFKGFEVKLVGSSIHKYRTFFKQASEEKVKQIQKMESEGKPLKEICKELKVSSGTVYKYSKKQFMEDR